MKKINLVVVGLATIGVLGLGQSAQAEETTASVKVNSGGIRISETSNITFDDVTVAKGGSTAEETDKSSITIEDLRGSSSQGWTLTAKLKDENFKGMALNVAPKIESNEGAATAGSKLSLNSDPQTIAEVADDKIVGTEFDTKVSLNATLDVPEEQLANTYTTTIVWNLAEGPGTK
ncbi:WxL domain-containing protein [Enterococcus sp. DIV1059_1]|uniref:WxL domain-containing protein n=1 Tax=Enterococcus sp. DIV1059_1 TaxID=2774902 RepID=UPI003F27AB23